MEDTLVGKGGKTGMRMYKLYTFSQDYGPKIGQEGQEVGESGGGRNCRERYVVYLQTGEQPPNANAIWRMAMGDDYYLLMTVSAKPTGQSAVLTL